MKATLFAVVVLGLAASSGPASAAPAVDCPATFKAFVARFMDDPAFQQAHVAEPLREERANSEGSSSRHAPRSRLRWPLIASTRELKRQHLELVFDGPFVVVRTPESDAFQMRYWFRRSDGCWMLVKRRDESE